MLDLSKYEKMYDSFDSGHDKNHLKLVRKVAIKLAKKYLSDKIDLVYIAATLHDIGLTIDREHHEKNGALMIKKDEYLKKHLKASELKQIIDAVKQHRATNGKPKTVLAKIISDADRTPESTRAAFMRAYDFSKKHYPEFSEQTHRVRAMEHLCTKFANSAYGRRCYFPETMNKFDKVFNPILNAYLKHDWEFFDKLIGM